MLFFIHAKKTDQLHVCHCFLYKIIEIIIHPVKQKKKNPTANTKGSKTTPQRRQNPHISRLKPLILPDLFGAALA